MFAPAVEHDLQGLLDRIARPIRGSARESVEFVCDRDNATLQRNSLGCQPARVAGAVETLMVRKGERGRHLKKFTAQPPQQPMAKIRVALRHFYLERRERPDLEQDALWDRYLAHVVQHTCQADSFAHSGRKPHSAGKQTAVVDYAFYVEAGIVSAELG